MQEETTRGEGAHRASFFAIIITRSCMLGTQHVPIPYLQICNAFTSNFAAVFVTRTAVLGPHSLCIHVHVEHTQDHSISIV